MMDVEEKLKELAILRGIYGVCSVCGKSKEYSDIGSKICKECYSLKRAEQARVKGREEYGHLLGQRVVALFVSSWDNDLAALELADGHIVEAESTHEGEAYLEVRNKYSGGRGTQMSHWDYAEIREEAS